jgi:hypothetical protein
VIGTLPQGLAIIRSCHRSPLCLILCSIGAALPWRVGPPSSTPPPGRRRPFYPYLRWMAPPGIANLPIGRLPNAAQAASRHFSFRSGLCSQRPFPSADDEHRPLRTLPARGALPIASPWRPFEAFPFQGLAAHHSFPWLWAFFLGVCFKVSKAVKSGGICVAAPASHAVEQGDHEIMGVASRLRRPLLWILLRFAGWVGWLSLWTSVPARACTARHRMYGPPPMQLGVSPCPRAATPAGLEPI